MKKILKQVHLFPQLWLIKGFWTLFLSIVITVLIQAAYLFLGVLFAKLNTWEHEMFAEFEYTMPMWILATIYGWTGAIWSVKRYFHLEVSEDNEDFSKRYPYLPHTQKPWVLVLVIAAHVLLLLSMFFFDLPLALFTSAVFFSIAPAVIVILYMLVYFFVSGVIFSIDYFLYRELKHGFLALALTVVLLCLLIIYMLMV